MPRSESVSSTDGALNDTRNAQLQLSHVNNTMCMTQKRVYLDLSDLLSEYVVKCDPFDACLSPQWLRSQYFGPSTDLKSEQTKRTNYQLPKLSPCLRPIPSPERRRERLKASARRAGLSFNRDSEPRLRDLDPNAPKRGLSAYMFFANDNREKVREENPGIKFGTRLRLCFPLAIN